MMDPSEIDIGLAVDSTASLASKAPQLSVLASLLEDGALLTTSLQTSAAKLEFNMNRLVMNLDIASADLRNSLRIVWDAAEHARLAFALAARRLQRHRSQWLNKQFEEVSAVEAVLQTGAGLCTWDGTDLAVIADGVGALLSLLHSHVSPKISAFIGISHSIEVTQTLASCSRITDGLVDPFRSMFGGECLQCFPLGNPAVVTLTCVDSGGDLVRGIIPEDATVTFGVVGIGEGTLVGPPVTDKDSPALLSFTLSLPDEPALMGKTATLHVTGGIFPPKGILASARVGGSIMGTFTGQVPLTCSRNRGLAISPTGVVVVSDFSTDVIKCYNKDDGTLTCTFGGPGEDVGKFKGPWCMGFWSKTGNLLIADYGNKRVQEMTLRGEYVRSIGTGSIEGLVAGLAVSRDGATLAVSSSDASTHIHLLDLESGLYIRGFGSDGKSIGQLSDPTGLRFTQDGTQLLIANLGGRHVAVFSVLGQFICTIGSGVLVSVWDLDFAPNGDILVADTDKQRICVFSPDGSTLLRKFGSQGEGPGLFRDPVSLAIHDGKLYVLDLNSRRVQCFI